MFDDDTAPATHRQADGGFPGSGLLGDAPSGRPLAPREDQHLHDLIEEGARAVRERELANEQAESDLVLRAMISPRYQAVMAELERKAERSSAVYLSTFKRFSEDCEALGLPALGTTPGVVAAYLENLRDCGANAARLRRERAAISFMHNDLEYPDPTRDLSLSRDRSSRISMKGDCNDPASRMARPCTRKSSLVRAVAHVRFAPRSGHSSAH